MLNQDSPIEQVPLVGPKSINLLNRMGLFTIKDLLYHIPIRHEDSSNLLSVEDFILQGEGTTKIFLKNIYTRRTRRMPITTAEGYDETGKIEIIWFNQPYLGKTFKEGSQLLLSGKLELKGGKAILKSPKYELLKEKQEETTHLGRISPVYLVTKGISVKWLRSRLKYLIDHIAFFASENYPEEFLKKYNLIRLENALKQIHFPENEVQIIEARRRLAFDELLNIQQILLNKRIERRGSSTYKIHPIPMQEIFKLFEFELTKSQISAIEKVFEDIQKGYPMKRLLAGDVGSGKTAIAMAASYCVCNSGYKTLYMAPTNILAEQHYQNFSKVFAKKLKISLLTGRITKKAKEEAIEADIIIGTQALLFSDKEKLKEIGLVVTDEQHKFGVSQREFLETEAFPTMKPHVLSLSATPIPRTLSLSLFGDIEVSNLETIPTGRLPVKTFVIANSKREESYTWIRKEIDENKAQVFFVCPFVENSEKIQAKSAEETFSRLKNTDFSNYRVGLIHGQMKDDQKNEVMAQFRDQKIDILVATPVIEVGIDIPGATIIVIENSERFGLSQLHQLRGRVGRSNKQSYCLAFYEEATETAKIRLKAFKKYNSGLKLAEVDLETRGPGEVYGIKQAGLPNLHVASLTDINLIKETKQAAELLVQL